MYEKDTPPIPPCFVGEGTLVSKKDMMRALETLETVLYRYNVDDQAMSEGEGIVVRVFSSGESSTLILNGCIFINVLSFDYLNFYSNKIGSSTLELVARDRSLKLTPLDENNQTQPRNTKTFLSSNFDDESYAPLLEDFSEEEED